MNFNRDLPDSWRSVPLSSRVYERNKRIATDTVKIVDVRYFWQWKNAKISARGIIASAFHSPWNSFLAALTEVTMLATCPSTVANSSRPNSSWAITNKYSPLLLGLQMKWQRENCDLLNTWWTFRTSITKEMVISLEIKLYIFSTCQYGFVHDD